MILLIKHILQEEWINWLFLIINVIRLFSYIHVHSLEVYTEVYEDEKWYMYVIMRILTTNKVIDYQDNYLFRPLYHAPLALSTWTPTAVISAFYLSR